MKRAPLAEFEQERLIELGKYRILDSDEEDDYNFLTTMAAQICGTDMALISLVAEDRQWFLSKVGLAAKETPREYSFCAHAITTPDAPFIVEDAREDERFHDNPLVQGAPNIVFYTGIPLINKNQLPLGTICVLDTKPKKLTDEQKQMLEKLAKQVVKLLELRRTNIELTQANEILTRNMLLLEETQKINDIGAWELDIATGETFWTELIYTIHEVGHDFDHNKKNGIEFYHPKYRPIITQALQECIVNNKPFDVTCMLITARGNEKWVRVTGRKINQKIYGGFHDITELKQNELKFEGMFHSSFSFIGFLDTEGKLIEVNDTALEASGLKKEDVINKYFWDCYWWKDNGKIRDELRRNISKALQGETLVYETVITIAEQKLTSILFSLKPVMDHTGRVLYIIPEGRPVQEIVEARHRYKLLLEGTNVGTWEWDIKAGKKTYNERWAGIMGYTLAEMEPITEKTWESIVHPDDWIEGEKKLQAHFEQKAAYYILEARIRHKNGHWVWVLDQGKIMEWNTEGEPLRMYGTLLDITERKERELEIIYQKDRLKNFAHIVSHNLRSHSAGISGIIDLMRADYPQFKENEYFQWLLQGADNLKQTVVDLTEIVKISMEGNDQQEQINLHDLVVKNERSLALQLKETDFKVHNELPTNLTVWGVPAYWDSIVLNMITNAIKYRSDGQNAQLTIQQLPQDDHKLLISFADNGQGIDLKKYGDKIFGMYKTFHKHEDARGVGLYITKNQVESMGGKVWVESTPQVGSTFYIMMPHEPIAN